MCEYSLQHVASRPAITGDELVTSTFPNSLTVGFTAVGEPGVAVCLLPGTEIAFQREAECRHPLAALFPKLRFGKLGAKLARFRQVNAHEQYAHHDALEFPDGKVVLLTRLRPGQRATVLQLPASLAAEGDIAAHDRAKTVVEQSAVLKVAA
jgi:hypothetical protein